MSLASDIVAAVLAAALIGVAVRKLSHQTAVVASYERVGVPEDRLNLLAAILLVAAVGLLLGILWSPLGVAAAIGLVVYFGLAIAAHVRFHDTVHIGPPFVLFLAATATLVLRLL